jgi:membrane protease YdiL (CAAX protease family)
MASTGVFSMPLAADTRLQTICRDDLGAFVTDVFEAGSSLFGRRIDIASDEKTGPEMARSFEVEELRRLGAEPRGRRTADRVLTAARSFRSLAGIDMIGVMASLESAAREDAAADARPVGTRGTVPFFAVAFGITSLSLLPANLAQRGVIAGPWERFMPLALPATLGPLLAALLVSYSERRGRGVRAWLRPLRTVRVGLVWYLVVLGSFAAMHMAGVAVYTLFGGKGAGAWLYLPSNPQQVAAMLLVPVGEEPGWRGFALPRLQTRYGARKASFILGIGWALWHIPMFILQGFSPGVFAIASLQIVVGSAITTWIYNRTRGSMLLAILAHVGMHLDSPFRAPPGAVTPIVIYLGAITVTAGVLLVVDRSAWRGPGPLPAEWGETAAG